MNSSIDDENFMEQSLFQQNYCGAAASYRPEDNNYDKNDDGITAVIQSIQASDDESLFQPLETL